MHSTLVTWVVAGVLDIWTEKNISSLRAILNTAEKAVSPESVEGCRIAEQVQLLNYAENFANMARLQLDYMKKPDAAVLASYQTCRTQYLEDMENLTKSGLLSLAQYVSDAYAPTHLQPTRTTMNLNESAKAPTSDTSTDYEPEWDIPDQRISYLVGDERGHCPSPITEANLTYTDSSLFVRVVCNDSMMNKLKIAGDLRDSNVWEGDCVRISLFVEGNIYSFFANPKGVVRDEKNSNAHWDSVFKYNVKRTDRLGKRNWSVRFEIPWKTLGLKRAPKQIRANIFRHVPGSKLYPIQSWSPTFGSFDDILRYVLLNLEK